MLVGSDKSGEARHSPAQTRQSALHSQHVITSRTPTAPLVRRSNPDAQGRGLCHDLRLTRDGPMGQGCMNPVSDHHPHAEAQHHTRKDPPPRRQVPPCLCPERRVASRLSRHFLLKNAHYSCPPVLFLASCPVQQPDERIRRKHEQINNAGGIGAIYWNNETRKLMLCYPKVNHPAGDPAGWSRTSVFR